MQGCILMFLGMLMLLDPRLFIDSTQKVAGWVQELDACLRFGWSFPVPGRSDDRAPVAKSAIRSMGIALAALWALRLYGELVRPF